MGSAKCMWCETEIRATSRVCPECGLENPVSQAEALSVASRRRTVATRGSRRVLLALLAAPLMLSVAYAAHITLAPNSGEDSPPAQLADHPALQLPATAAVTDPVQRGVWLNGMRAVRLALANPDFAGFQQSYLQKSAGRMVSLCGTIPSGELSGMRFVSVAGDSSQTIIEGRDPSFETLWTRLCGSTDQV